MILDYIRHYGERALGGITFVDAITKLGSEEAASVLTPEFLNLVPGLFSTDVEESTRSLRSLLRMCVAQEPPTEDLYLTLGYNVSVPPSVRQALLSRSFDNDDLLPTLQKPVLIVHGDRDPIVKPSVVDQHKASLPHAEVAMMPNAAHAPFWDDAPSFERASARVLRTARTAGCAIESRFALPAVVPCDPGCADGTYRQPERARHPQVQAPRERECRCRGGTGRCRALATTPHISMISRTTPCSRSARPAPA